MYVAGARRLNSRRQTLLLRRNRRSPTRSRQQSRSAQQPRATNARDPPWAICPDEAVVLVTCSCEHLLGGSGNRNSSTQTVVIRGIWPHTYVGRPVRRLSRQARAEHEWLLRLVGVAPLVAVRANPASQPDEVDDEKPIGQEHGRHPLSPCYCGDFVIRQGKIKVARSGPVKAHVSFVRLGSGRCGTERSAGHGTRSRCLRRRVCWSLAEQSIASPVGDGARPKPCPSASERSARTDLAINEARAASK